MYQLLLRYHVRFALRFFEKNRGAKIVTVLGFFAAFLFLVGLVYESFFYGFKYVARDVYFGEALSIYIVELFFLVSFALVYVSALLSGFFSIFRTSSDIIVVASPSYQLKLMLVFLRMFFSSLWPLLTIILPALVAFHQVFGLSLLGLLLGVLSSVLLIAIANAFAVVTVLLVADILDSLDRFSVRNSIIGTSLFLFGMLFLAWERFRALNLVSFFQARMLDSALPDLTPILHQFRIFPSHFSALTIFYGELHQYANALYALGTLTVILLLFMMCFLLLKGEYLGLWQKGQEGKTGEKSAGASHPYAMNTLMRHADSPSSAMLRKEFITFFRNPRGLLWLGFIIFIWVIQSASSRVLVYGLGAERVADSMIPVSVSSLQFAVILYFVSMFVLRFAFPSFSAERKSMWAIHSAPLRMSRVFIAKLSFYVALFAAIAIVFTLWNSWTLGLLLPLGLPIFVAIILGTFFLTTFGLSLGAVYPNSETDDPERLSTTLPGIGFIFVALCYGVFGAYALKNYFSGHGFLPFSLFIFLSLALSLLCIVRSTSALRDISAR